MAKAKKHRVTHYPVGVIPGCRFPVAPGSDPEGYVGPIPSYAALAYIAKCEQAHEEWQRRRADIKGWYYNLKTGMAESKPVKAAKKTRKALEAA